MASLTNSYFSTIFVFPFKYLGWKGGREITLSPNDAVKQLLNPKGWHESFFAIEELKQAGGTFDERRFRHYAEWHYFHPWVREMIFDRKESKEHPMRYLTRNDYTRLKADFKVRKEEGGEEIPVCVNVRMRSIDLHLYANQIGLLTITTEKEEGPDNDFETLLRFNDAARRVYPPFLATADGHEENTSYPKAKNILPQNLALWGPETDKIDESFGNLKLPQSEPYLSEVIRKLLSPLKLKGWNAPKNDTKDEALIYYEPFTDDRMFIVSYCINPELSRTLRSRCCGQYAYENSDLWYCFMFADGSSPGLANDQFKRQLIQNSSYARFIDDGTLFGMTRYSFVAIGDGEYKPLRDHMKSMYYQLALIVLFQRAMLWKFSQDVKVLTRELDFSELFRKAAKLNKDFTEFTNRYWHSEVTPQEQGIEIYNQWTKLLEHDRLYDDVHAEIDDLATIVRIQLEEERRIRELELAAAVRTLTIGGLILTLWLVLFGEGWYKMPWPIPSSWRGAWWLQWTFIVLFCGSVLVWLIGHVRTVARWFTSKKMDADRET